jgi:hypothetical protein
MAIDSGRSNLSDDSGDGYAASRCANVLVVVHASGPVSPVILAIQRHIESLRRVYPDSLGLLVIANRGTTPPDSPERSSIAHLLREMRNKLSTAVVLEGAGFWAATAMSAATFIGNIASTSIKLFNDTPGAIDWLLPRVSQKGRAQVTAAELARVVEALRVGAETK